MSIAVPRSPIKMTQQVNDYSKTKPWTEMNQQAQFIIWSVIISFLICDYEYCISITENDFSEVY